MHAVNACHRYEYFACVCLVCSTYIFSESRCVRICVCAFLIWRTLQSSDQFVVSCRDSVTQCSNDKRTNTSDSRQNESLKTIAHISTYYIYSIYIMRYNSKLVCDIYSIAYVRGVRVLLTTHIVGAGRVHVRVVCPHIPETPSLRLATMMMLA